MLFTWTPVVALAAAGLLVAWRRDRLVCASAAVFLAVSWYINAAAADWWAGEAFGARRFVSCFPVFCLDGCDKGCARAWVMEQVRPERCFVLTQPEWTHFERAADRIAAEL